MYAKLISGTLRSAPKKVAYNGKTILNPPEEILLDMGYLPVTYTDMPTDAPEGRHYESSWIQTDAEIVQVWTLADDLNIPEPEPTPEERIAVLEEKQEITDTAVQDLILTMMGGE